MCSAVIFSPKSSFARTNSPAEENVILQFDVLYGSALSLLNHFTHNYKNIKCPCTKSAHHSWSFLWLHWTPHNFNLMHDLLVQQILFMNTLTSVDSPITKIAEIRISNLSMSQHISNTCKAAYIQIRHISSIQHLLTTQAIQTLVCSLVLSRLDYFAFRLPSVLTRQTSKSSECSSKACV